MSRTITWVCARCGREVDVTDADRRLAREAGRPVLPPNCRRCGALRDRYPEGDR